MQSWGAVSFSSIFILLKANIKLKVRKGKAGDGRGLRRSICRRKLEKRLKYTQFCICKWSKKIENFIKGKQIAILHINSK